MTSRSDNGREDDIMERSRRASISCPNHLRVIENAYLSRQEVLTAWHVKNMAHDFKNPLNDENEEGKLKRGGEHRKISNNQYQLFKSSENNRKCLLQYI